VWRGNLAIYAAYSSDFTTAEREATAVETPTDLMTLALAFAKLGQGQLPQAIETYQALAKISARGASWAASGLADLALYEGRLSEAARMFEESANVDLAAKNGDRAARKFTSLGYVQLLRGEPRAAVASAEAALKNSNTVEVRLLAARILVEANEVDRARKLAASLEAELPAEPQAYGKIIEGEIALKSGEARQAIKLLTDANEILDTWLGHYDLGRAYLQAKAFPQADSEIDRCIKRSGEALALFADEEPTFGYFPIVYYYQGRIREALNHASVSDAYRSYLNSLGQSTEDPLVLEIKRRLGTS
jgi:tetratricopeptide (TPR) repeat protein